MPISYQDLCISEAEYLKVEETSREKHEYIAGRLFAMSGATVAHNLLIGNLYRHIFDPVKAAGCRVFMNDMKVKIETLRSCYYPDLIISCEQLEPDAVMLAAPCLVIEVLSPSTMNVDRREKLIAYRSIESLQEYSLVYQNKRQIEVYRKDTDANWHCQVFSTGQTIELSALAHDNKIIVEVDAVYADTGIT